MSNDSFKSASISCVVGNCVHLCFPSDCRANRYGPDCAETCECENGAQCDRRNGRCTCLQSWIGLSCQEGTVMTSRHTQWSYFTVTSTWTAGEELCWLLSRNRSDTLADLVKSESVTSFSADSRTAEAALCVVFVLIKYERCVCAELDSQLFVCVSSGGPPRLTYGGSRGASQHDNSL